VLWPLPADRAPDERRSSPGPDQQLRGAHTELHPPAAREPGISQQPEELVRRGQVRGGCGQVFVCTPVGEQSANHRDDPPEVQRVRAAHQRVWRLGHFKEDGAAAWADHPRRLAEAGGNVDHVAQRKPADRPIDGRITQRQVQSVGAHQGRRGVRLCEHSGSHVDAHRTEARAPEDPAEIAGPAPEVDNTRPWLQVQLAHRATPPARVEAKGHHAVHQLVARRDPVEHLLDGSRLPLADRKFGPGHESTLSSTPHTGVGATPDFVYPWQPMEAITTAEASTTASDARPVAARTNDAVKEYGKGDAMVRALDGITVAFDKSQFSAIMGPSGSGKSTLLHCLAGLDRLTSGTVHIGDIELGSLNDRQLTMLRRVRVGFIFQSFNLVPTLSALDNIVLPLTIAGQKPDAAALAEVVRITGLGDRLKHRPNELSGGQQQRVAAARALASRPEIIFADEPTGNLDSRASTDLLDFLRHAVTELGQTIIMVTHDPLAAAHADRVVFLADGRVVSEMHGPTADTVLDVMRHLGD
jgi:putative ABC transport system ATP-binding protein